VSRRNPLETAFCLIIAFAMISALVPKAKAPTNWPERIFYYGAAFILGASLVVWIATLIPAR
jgi:hypothetical protein